MDTGAVEGRTGSPSLGERERLALLHSIFASGSDGLAFVDPGLVLRAINRRSLDELSLSGRQVVGRSLPEVLPDWADLIESVFREVRATGQPCRVKRHPFIFPDQPGRGVTYWNLTVSPVIGDEGAFLGYLILHREVTEEGQAEEERQSSRQQLWEMNRSLAIGAIRERGIRLGQDARQHAAPGSGGSGCDQGELTERAQRQAAELDATIASIADGVLIYDQSGRVVRINPAAKRILGGAGVRVDNGAVAGAWAGRGSLQLLREDGSPVPPEEMPAARALAGESVQGVVGAIKAADGRLIWISCSAGPIYCRGTGIGRGQAVAGTDAGGRPGANRDEREGRERGELIGAVVTITDITALHHLQEQREEFIHLISHDLRNPITAVIGQAQILQRRLTESGQDRDARSAAAIVHNGQRINGMIAELVESARLEMGRLELNRAPVDLRELVAGVVEQIWPPDDQERVRVETTGAVPPVMADPRRIERAVVNLISNALKFSPPETQVVVSVLESDGEGLVSVSDRGTGISAADLPHVFERLYRAHAGTDTEGLGLGLYITRLLVEAHGGSIWAESRLGEGSTFYFTLPAEEWAGRLQGNRQGGRKGLV